MRYDCVVIMKVHASRRDWDITDKGVQAGKMYNGGGKTLIGDLQV